MKLGSTARYEIQAEAFRRMTGHMAPGKDAAALSYPAPYEERKAAWDRWLLAHGACVSAMLEAMVSVLPDEDEGGADR